MADKMNFLLGVSDYFTEELGPPKMKPSKKIPYSFDVAQQRLIPRAKAVARELAALPQDACPRDEAVAVVTLHPEFLAKTYYPAAVLREAGLETVGSRSVDIAPEKRTTRSTADELPSTALYVAGSRAAFEKLPDVIGRVSSTSRAGEDLPKLEEIAPLTAALRVKKLPRKVDEPSLELVLHAGPKRRFVLEAFQAYAAKLGFTVEFDRQFEVGTLNFVPAHGPREKIADLAQFSFLRVVRSMPRLRPFESMRSRTLSFPLELPKLAPIDASLHAAVFDGGVPKATSMSPWVNSFDASGVGAAVPEYEMHGSQVTSALLFGPLTKGVMPPRPYAQVDHYRVLDAKSGEQATLGKNDDLYDVLHRIDAVLSSNPYRFVGLSIGPELAVDDDDVHPWTSVLDSHLSDGETLAMVAVGNTGERDAEARLNRVQVPSDCVNAIAVGATDRRGASWKRADYSSVGPGRSPGLVKPDLVAFGGSASEPFYALGPNVAATAFPQAGTSFAGPAGLRLGLGVRAHFGDLLSPLAIRALLIHCTESNKSETRESIGWGRMPEDLEDLVICSPGVVRVVYQGELRAGQYLRARVPVPDKELDGRVRICTTVCYACDVDPAHPGNYTRAGLDVWFRPHDQRFSKTDKSEEPDDDEAEVDGRNPKSSPFFRLKEYSNERDLRRDAHKWETVMHRVKGMEGTSLSNPVFDLHYNARIEGHGAGVVSEKLRYAMVITLSALKMKDLYDDVVRRYPTQIRQLRPVVEVPIRTRGDLF